MHTLLYGVLMWLATAASAIVVVAYVIRSILYRELNYFDSKLNKQRTFDPVSDWMGHGLHGVGMTYMGLVMLGVIPAVIPFSWLVAFYALSAVVFAYRVGAKQYLVWWWDVLHIFMSAGMAYMFLDVSVWQPIITLVFTVYYLWLVWKYVRDYLHDTSITVPRRRFVVLLSDAGHIGIGLAMALMLVVMQWPSLVGMAGMEHEMHGDHSHGSETVLCQDSLPANVLLELEAMEMGNMTHVTVHLTGAQFGESLHWHLYVDGSDEGMYEEEMVMLDITGYHTFEARLSGESHCEYSVSAQAQTGDAAPGHHDH